MTKTLCCLSLFTSFENQTNKMVLLRRFTKLEFLLFCIILSTLIINTIAKHKKTLPPTPIHKGKTSHPGGNTTRSPPRPRLLPLLPPLLSPLLPPLLSPLLPPLLPPVLVFLDQRLAAIYPIIQNFKNIITLDPLGITKTWVGSNICSYKGFYCDSPPDNISAIAVASIDFNGFQLAAPTLDGFIDQLPDLALFHANSNSLSGTISPNIAKLQYLYEFDISNNLFTGSFPDAILGMDSLTFLDVRFNSFTGSIPQEIFNRALDALFINNNNFMQKLPDNIGKTKILYLTLANNKFFGPIPHDIAKYMGGLTEILLLNNLLSGCLPYELGFLNEAVVFDAGNNQLMGPIPISLGCLAKLEVLSFSGNQLFGMVPDEVCGGKKLGNLSLAENYFTGVGSVCMDLIRNGVLDVRKNCIPGLPGQRSVQECSVFFAKPNICPYNQTYSLLRC